MTSAFAPIVLNARNPGPMTGAGNNTYLVVRAAAKIYRVGILLYGKRPGLQELIRWLRY